MCYLLHAEKIRSLQRIDCDRAIRRVSLTNELETSNNFVPFQNFLWAFRATRYYCSLAVMLSSIYADLNQNCTGMNLNAYDEVPPHNQSNKSMCRENYIIRGVAREGVNVVDPFFLGPTFTFNCNHFIWKPQTVVPTPVGIIFNWEFNSSMENL